MMKVRIPESTHLRVDRILSTANDPTLLILRGHLLVEEIIERFLLGMFSNQKYLRAAHLTFSQKLNLVFAYADFPPKEEVEDNDLWGALDMWGSVRMLGELRNALAHRAEPDDLEGRLHEFLRTPLEGRNEPVAIEDLRSELSGMCSYLDGFMDAWIEEVHR